MPRTRWILVSAAVAATLAAGIGAYAGASARKAGRTECLVIAGVTSNSSCPAGTVPIGALQLPTVTVQPSAGGVTAPTVTRTATATAVVAVSATATVTVTATRTVTATPSVLDGGKP